MRSVSTSSRGASPRARWRVLTMAMIAALAVYAAVLLTLRGTAVIPTPPPPETALRVALLASGATLLAAAVAWTLAMLPGAPSLTHERTALEAEGRRFLIRSLMASALAEGGGLAGFTLALLGGPLTEALALLGTSLIVQAAILLPRGEGFWRAWEEQRPATRG